MTVVEPDDGTAVLPTPGPWEVLEAYSVERGVWLVNGYLYGALRGARGVTAGDVGLRRLYQGKSEADARLIAAAPDLLALVKTVVEAGCDNYGDCRFHPVRSRCVSCQGSELLSRIGGSR